MVGETISHYRVEARIGAGGMGEVFKAYDTQLERPVAIKRLHSELNGDPAYRHRFLREARHAAQITHQNVAGIHDVLESGGQLFLVMEYVEGEDLNASRLDRKDIPSLLRIAIKCAEAMVAAHEMGLVHRDIKPANIMLTRSGEIKILDFGLARRQRPNVSSLSQDETLTEPSEDAAVQGTLAYMAPEVLRGRQADHRSDLFSIGIVFYQLLTGDHPFAAETRPTIINRILNCSPVPLVRLNPLVPLELDECVFRLLEKDPQLRYASAEDLLAHLRKIERDTSFDHRNTGAEPVPQSWPGRHRTVLAVFALATVAAAAFLLFKALVPPPIPENPVIAVLPFDSVTKDEPSVAFAAGLSEMVNHRLNELSLKLPLTTVPGYYVRALDGQTPQKVQSIGANLALTGRYELHDGNAAVYLSLASAETMEVLREVELSTPLSKSADLEYSILDKALDLLEINRSTSGRILVSSYPSSQAAYDYFLRGLGYYSQGRIPDAIATLERSLQMEPNLALAQAYLGLALLREEQNPDSARLQRARELCIKAQGLDRHLQAADYCIGGIALAQGDFGSAVKSYESAIQKGPLEVEILDGLLSATRETGPIENVIPALEALTARQPRIWVGYNYLAYIYYEAGDFESAVREQQESVKRAPKRATGYKNLAVYYDHLGCPEQTAQCYASALALERHSSTYTNMAATLYYSGRYPEALEAAEAAKISLDREDEPSYTESGNLADINYWSPAGDRETGLAYYREALEEVNRLLEKEPGDLALIRSKCWFLAMLGQNDPARQCVADLTAFPQPDYRTCYRLALIYQRFGEEEKALEYLKRSLDQGMRADQVHHDPVFRGNRAVAELLSNYSEAPGKCP